MMFDDLIIEVDQEKESKSNPVTEKEETSYWDTELVWSTGQVPRDIWTIK